MPSGSSLLGFAALSFALIVVPGPSVLFIVGRAVALGRRAALITVIGNATGVYVQILAVAAGLGAVVERSVAVFTALKLAGAAYLVWLGVQSIRSRQRVGRLDDPGHGGLRPRRSIGSVWRDGFVVGVANPKSVVFFVAILPQFVDPGRGPAALQMAALGVVFVAIAVMSDGAWGLAAGSARAWFAGSPRRLERLAAVGGAVMIGLGVRLAFVRR